MPRSYPVAPDAALAAGFLRKPDVFNRFIVHHFGAILA